MTTSKVILKSHLFQQQQPFNDQQLLSPLMKMPSVKPVKKIPKNHSINLKTTFKFVRIQGLLHLKFLACVQRHFTQNNVITT